MKKLYIFFLIFLAFAISTYVILFVPPFSQNCSYHHFADTSLIFGVTNFYNVITNSFFFLIGFIALYKLYINKTLIILEEVHYLYFILFAGLIFVSLGSGYYHLNPNNETLLWDRLPMSISFMALFSIVIAEFISMNLAKYLSFPLIIAGMASVLYWYVSELNGVGDLRYYILIQFLPMLIIPMILLLFSSRFNQTKGYWFLLLLYLLAKLCEYFDTQIYTFLEYISGHSIKHMFAALALYILIYVYERRKLKSS